MVGDGRRFAYALVSAAPLEGTDATGIGIVFKGPDRGTIATVCQALEGVSLLEAGYEAIRRVLDEALEAGLRRLTIYTDLHEIVAQLTDEAEVPRELLVTHLKTRGTMHQIGEVKLVGATAKRFSAREIAECARPGGQGPPSGRESGGSQGRLLEGE